MAGQDYIIHVGRLHPGKRQDRLIEAYALSHITAPLVMLGQGKPEQEERLRAWLKSWAWRTACCLKAFRATHIHG
jgi:glycosyltransferase involved in cell wall biosynthesis